MCDQPAANALALRIIAGITFACALIELIIGLVVYTSFTSPKVGAWWAAVVILISSILGLISTNRGVVIGSMVIAIIGVIVGAIGCAVDGIANTILTSLVTCVSNEGDCTGDSNYCYLASYCSYFSDDCSCIQSSGSTCFYYNGGLASDCDNVLTKYTSSLHAVFAFDLLATFGVFALAIAACVSVCCPSYGTGYSQPVPQTDGGVNIQVQNMPPQTQAGYPQQQAYPQQAYPQQAYPQQAYAGQPVVAQGVVIDGTKH